MSMAANYFGSVRHRKLKLAAHDVAERIAQFERHKVRRIRDHYAAAQIVLTLCPAGLLRLEPHFDAAEVDVVGRYSLAGLQKLAQMTEPGKKLALPVLALADRIEKDIAAHPHYAQALAGSGRRAA